MNNLLKICPVCGWTGLEELPYSDFEGGCPSYETCSCCGFQFGYHDSNSHYTFKKYRDKWIIEGFRFYNYLDKPNIWNEQIMHEQLNNIEKLSYKPRI